MEFQDLADRIDLDLTDYLELVELFVETSLTDILKIEVAVQNNDPETAARAIHSIKGAAGNLGFMEIHDAAQKLETDARARPLAEIAGSVGRLKTAISEIADQTAPF